MLEEAEIEIYIQRRRDTLFNFMKNREIYRECLELETGVENSDKDYSYWLIQALNVNNTIIT